MELSNLSEEKLIMLLQVVNHFDERCFGSQVLRASVIFVQTQAGDFSMVARVSPLSSGGPASRCRERRLRSFWRHEQLSLKMMAASMSHDSEPYSSDSHMETCTGIPGRYDQRTRDNKPGILKLEDDASACFPVVECIGKEVSVGDSWAKRAAENVVDIPGQVRSF